MPLVYSSNPPTKPGHYWLRRKHVLCKSPAHYEYIVELILTGEQLFNVTHDNSFSSRPGDLWAGPIDKPMTANEYHLVGYIT